jgi:hypothetical protein
MLWLLDQNCDVPPLAGNFKRLRFGSRKQGSPQSNFRLAWVMTL